jgi:hypothetical protein
MSKRIILKQSPIVRIKFNSNGEPDLIVQDVTSEAGSGGGIELPISMTDVSGLVAALAGKQAAAIVLTNTTASFTTALETKLNGIAAGAEVNVNPDWNASSGDAQILNKPNLSAVATSGSYADLSNKPSIPTLISQLTNDSAYITNSALAGYLTSSSAASTYETIANVTSGLAAKQATLVSGVNLKSINGVSLLSGGDLVISAGGAITVQDYTNQTANPSAPSAGSSKVYVKNFGTGVKGKSELNILSEDSTFPQILDSRFADSWSCFAQPQINSATLAVFGFGGLNPQVGSFAAAGNINTLTNLYASMPRVLARSSSAANNRFEVVQSGNAHMTPSDGTNGGFDVTIRWGISLLPSGMRCFVGITSSIFNASNALNTLTQCIGLGFNPGDANLSLVQNAGVSGSGVLTDLGSNFPANTTGVDVYQLRIVSRRNLANNIFVEVKRMNTGHKVEFNLTTSIPGSGFGLSPMFGGWNNATASMAEIAIFSYHCKREF